MFHINNHHENKFTIPIREISYKKKKKKNRIRYNLMTRLQKIHGGQEYPRNTYIITGFSDDVSVEKYFVLCSQCPLCTRPTRWIHFCFIYLSYRGFSFNFNYIQISTQKLTSIYFKYEYEYYHRILRWCLCRKIFCLVFPVVGFSGLSVLGCPFDVLWRLLYSYLK
jgi:hypothetical protein